MNPVKKHQVKNLENYALLAFSDSVKKIQTENGSRERYMQIESLELNQLRVSEIDFITRQNMFYLATVGEEGWPYLQHKGGSNGFLKVLTPKKIAYADFGGNRQYISAGNMMSSKKVMLFMMDYARKRRLKIWAETEIVSREDAELSKVLVDENYAVNVERFIVMHIKGFDWNCPQYIDQRFTLSQYEKMIENGSLKLNPRQLQKIIANQK